MIANDSSVDVLYYGAYICMNLGYRKLYDAKNTFIRNEVKVIRTITPFCFVHCTAKHGL